MKTFKILSFMAVIVVTIIASACNKKNEVTDLTSEITGTYAGTLTINGQKSISDATVNIISTGENQIEIHCYGDEIDTTIIQRLFEDGEMIQMCSVGQDFYNMYGHEMNNQYNHHNMMNDSDGLSWAHHMDEEHDSDDEHFGFFNMNTETFEYMFKIRSESGSYNAEFVGTKK